MPKTFCFHLPDITCQSCIQSVEDALRGAVSKKGLTIESFSGCSFSQKITITIADNHQIKDEEICQILMRIINKTQIQPCEIVDLDKNIPSQKNNPDSAEIAEQPNNIQSHVIKGVIGIAVGIILILLVLTGVMLPPVAMYLLMGGSALLTFILGAESYYNAFIKLVKTKTLTMDALFTVSTLTVIGMSIASIFLPGMFPMMMETGLLIFGFYHIGQAVKASVREQVTKGLLYKDFAVERVKKFIQQDQSWEECAVETLKVDDIIRVEKGETIPVDGVCESHHGWVFNINETGVTDHPVTINYGGKILAGMEVYNEPIEIKVTQQLKDSYLVYLDETVAQANKEKLLGKSLIEITTNKILQYFIPAVLGVAVISGIVIGIMFNPALALLCAAFIVGSACPCILGLATELAVRIGMVKARENDLQFKSTRALEDASNIDIVVFDLNGTLTGMPVVTGHSILNTSPEEFFACLYSMENGLQHPVAKAICTYAKANLTHDFDIHSVSKPDLTNHSGVKATVDGDDCLIGNKNLLIDHGIEVPEIPLDSNQADQIIHYLVKKGIVIGYVTVKRPLREGAKFTIKELTDMGKNVHICSGDVVNVKHYAKELGIPEQNIVANYVSASRDSNVRTTKINYIKDLKAQNKRVAMVGDDANDAPAIAESHFGIAVNSANKLTKYNAGALIDKVSLLPVVTAFKVADETIWSVKQNLVISLAFNMTVILLPCILVAIGFALNPAIGVALMVLQMTLVLLNQYRIKCQELDHLKRYKDDRNKDGSNPSAYQICLKNGFVPQQQKLNSEITSGSGYEYEEILHQEPITNPKEIPLYFSAKGITPTGVTTL